MSISCLTLEAGLLGHMPAVVRAFGIVLFGQMVLLKKRMQNNPHSSIALGYSDVEGKTSTGKSV